METIVRSLSGVVVGVSGLAALCLAALLGGGVVATAFGGLATLACLAGVGAGLWGVVEVLATPGEYLWTDGLRFVVALVPAAFSLGAGTAAVWLAGATASVAGATGSLVFPLLAALGLGAAGTAVTLAD